MGLATGVVMLNRTRARCPATGLAKLGSESSMREWNCSTPDRSGTGKGSQFGPLPHAPV